MRTIVFDTETTGKADFKQKDNLAIQPHIVQLAAKLFDGKALMAALSLVVIPESRGDRVAVPVEAAGVHGITDEVIDRVGVPMKVAFAAFNNLLRRADRLVAHNVDFDYLIIRAGYSRIAAEQQLLWDIPKFCTMRTAEPILKLPGKYGFKFPTLMETHEHFFNCGFDGAHDALVDVDACAKVMFALEDAGHALWRLK